MAAVYKILRRVFNSNSSLDSGCYDLQNGIIHSVIQSGTAVFICKIGLQLEEEPVPVRVSKELITSRYSASSSDDVDGDVDVDVDVDGDGDCDGDVDVDGCGEVVITRQGVKVSSVDCETFAHGFGLRDDDIIISVNNRGVKSFEMVANMIHYIMKSSKNSHLRMEIHRRERGLIILDNGGDDVCAWDDDELICIDSTTSKLKAVRFRKFLMATSSRISLSNWRTPADAKKFTIKHYAKIVGNAGEKLVALKHNKTNKWIQVQNGKVTLEPAPAGDGHTLPIDSNYLLKVVPGSRRNVTLQPVNETGKALGFTSKRGSLTLLPSTDRKAQYEIFTSST